MLKKFYVRYSLLCLLLYFAMFLLVVLAVSLPLRDDYTGVEDAPALHLLLKFLFLAAPVWPALLFLKDHVRAPTVGEAVKFSAGVTLTYLAATILILFSTNMGMSEFVTRGDYFMTIFLPEAVKILIGFGVAGFAVFYALPRLVSKFRKN